MSSRGRRSIIQLVALLAATTLAHALTDEEIFRDFRFNLINPGARSLALGGAFISLADDATAAQANPAGLSFLNAQEYFGEYRYVDNASVSRTSRETLPAGINTFVATGTDLEDSSSSTFLSVVLPVGPKWRLGISRQELLRQDSNTVNAFSFTSTSGGTTGAFLLSGTGFLDTKIINYNFSAGYRFEKLAIGASIAYSELSLRSEVQNLIVDTDGTVTGVELLEPTPDVQTNIDDDDSDIGLNLGLIYGDPSDEFRVGAVYRRAPKFAVTETLTAIPPMYLDTFGLLSQFGSSFTNEFNTPDSYGVSLAFQPAKPARLTIVQDFVRTWYSQLAEGFVPGVNVLTDFDAKFAADDALDYHLGVEYILLVGARPLPLALRGGLFTESDTAIRAITTGTNSFATPASFPPRDGEIHGAAGIGLAFKQFRLDFAADIASSANQYLFSLIYHGKEQP